MNSKITFKLLPLAVICFLLSFSLQAQESSVTVKMENAGTLNEKIGNDANNIINLSIYGKINYIDLAIINKMSKLQSLDISNASIEECVFNEINYRANMLPEGIFNNKTLLNCTLPNSIISIGSYSFAGCPRLTSILIPNSVISIGDGAFYGCSNLASITIPNTVTSIGECTFLGCTGLTSINIPNSVASIGRSAFCMCTGLTSITIPNSVTYIGDRTYMDCAFLTSVRIGSGVKSIGNQAFMGCERIAEIHCKALIPPNISSTFSEINRTTCKLYVPKGTYMNYWLTDEWGNFTNIIEETSDEQVIYNIILSCNNGGKITVNGSNVTSTTLNKGNSVTIKFISNDSYTLSKVTLDGNDITNTISDNSYTISNITNDITINATFTEIPIYLTFKQADNGSVKRLISKGSTSTYIIEPTEGWRVNSIMFNGLDVTSQLDAKNQYTTPAITANSTLSISFESTNTAIIQTKASNIKVYTEQDVIVVKGAELGDNISVYTESGALLQTTKVTDNTIRIAVPSNKIYLIRTTDKTFKVSL